MSSAGRIAAVGSLLLVFGIVALVLLGGDDPYRVKVRFQSATAVVKGNVVQVAGRPVGIVESLELTPDGIAAVRSQVNPDKLDHLSRRWSARDAGHTRPLSGILPPSGSGGEPIRRE